ncbi:MAG: carboxymuconolactone decarboxylase family protein [Comamonadaceae bacterium]|nr:MAG: carboxymuconolactone decarboxylase family protein [Comamonadaceae bacterium]
MARIPLLNLAEVPGALGDTLRARRPANLYRILAHAPTLAPGFVQFGVAVLTDMELPADLRELVILRIGHMSGARYEIDHHRPMARAAGVAAQKVDAVLTDGMADAGWTELERAVLRFTEEVLRDVKASAQAYEAVAAHLSHRALVELMLTIGQYMGLARLLENLEVDADSFLHQP